MGDMTLADLDAELIARGFSAFPSEQRYRYINWAAKAIANKFPWFWEEQVIDLPWIAGTYRQLLSDVLPDFKSLRHIVVTTAGQERQLQPMQERDFVTKWLPLDLASTANRGEPDHYLIYNQYLYIIRPPTADRSLVITYHRFPPTMGADPNTDRPITPAHLDEAIVLAAVVRCHRRAYEDRQEAMARADLQELLDDMASEETFREEELQDRVRPDDTWA